MLRTVIRTASLVGIGLVVPVLAISAAAVAGILFQDRLGSASIPILTAGAFLVLICIIAVIFTAGRLRAMITKNDRPVIGRLSHKKIIVLFGLVFPAISVIFYKIVDEGLVAQPTAGETGTVYSVLLSFCTMWLLIGVTERHGGL